MTAGNFHYAAKQIVFAAIAARHSRRRLAAASAQVKIAALAVFLCGADRLLPGLVRRHRCAGCAPRAQSRLMTLQPSEFLKPGFAVLAAAMLADRTPTLLSQAGDHLRADRARACRPPSAARCGPDLAIAGLVGALLFFSGWGSNGLRPSAARRPRCWAPPMCSFPHVHHRVPIPRSRPTAIRQVWRSRPLPMAGCWRRARRGHDQVPHSRRAFRLHFRGGGRGVRFRAVRI